MASGPVPFTRRLAPALSVLLVLPGLGRTASAQTGGVSREAMWPAPTAEDWAKPCLITWQRTWKDAVELSQRTGKMILVCVNMDGEIASEHYAGIRYRQPEIAALYEPYVTVIASVYRHNPRDYDEEGRRILCPRFGSVTCGEHIWIEPILYEQFMEGRRIAPRHIGVELDGRETYDVFYAFDTDSVFQAIEDGVADRPEPPQPDLGDRTLVERVSSPDVHDREAVEREYVEGSQEVRRELVRAAIQAGEAASVDLLRLAVYDLDVELNRLALLALAQANDESAIGLINEALRVPMDSEDREALIAALERMGDAYPRARTLAAVHRGLDARSDTVDVEEWSTALPETAAPVQTDDRLALEYKLRSTSQVAEERPEDPRLMLDLAEASLALTVDPETSLSLASDPNTGFKFEELMFQDVLRNARRAEELGETGWRVDAVIALASYYTGDEDEAYARAEAAVAAMPSGEDGWNAMGVLDIFAQGRQRAVYRAVRDKTEWPAQWLTDVNAAYSVLARHPLGTEHHVASHYDFLRFLGGEARAKEVLEQGLERFPDSWPLHGRLRARVLREKGVEKLEAEYDRRLAAGETSPNLVWFAGYASLVAAEYRRRAGEDAEAAAAYDRAIEHYEAYIAAAPEDRDNADHYVALAIAGRARLALERRDYERALEEIVASFERKPDAAATLDGLGLSPVGTAKTLKARLLEAERMDLVARIDAALDALDPKLLELPAFEREAPLEPLDQGRGRGGRRGRRR